MSARISKYLRYDVAGDRGLRYAHCVSGGLPAIVLELLEQRLDTFEKVELIVALAQAPRTSMAIEALATSLKVPKETIRQTALQLCQVDLVELTSRGEVQLVFSTTRDLDAVKELTRCYEEDRLSITKALGTIALDRIRNMASRAFAGAFVLRKKPPGGTDDG